MRTVHAARDLAAAVALPRVRALAAGALCSLLAFAGPVSARAPASASMPGAAVVLASAAPAAAAPG
ncbi:MAG: hypothetical protein O9284_18985, partial [Steroidobacteraceae bacterium]|nr:hypothetical protein [Steroidobacteraceae bacterium]